MENIVNEQPTPSQLSNTQSRFAYYSPMIADNFFTNNHEVITENPDHIFINRRRNRMSDILARSQVSYLALNARQARRRDQANSDESSIDEVTTTEREYIDFRNYPLNLDWKELDNVDTISYEILHKYGYVGLSLYTKFKKCQLGEISRCGNFLMLIIEAYNERIDDKNANNTLILEFMKLLPSLADIREILNKRLFSSRDILPLKMIIDIYENYYFKYDYPLYENLINQMIQNANLFYITITDEDIKTLCNTFKSRFKKYIGKKNIFKTREKYLEYYKKLKNDMKRLSEGNCIEKFVL